MTKLNRRSFLLSAGLAAIAAPVLAAAPKPTGKELYNDFLECWIDLRNHFDGLSANEQQKLLEGFDIKRDIVTERFNDGKDVSDVVKNITDQMKKGLIARRKVQ